MLERHTRNFSYWLLVFVLLGAILRLHPSQFPPVIGVYWFDFLLLYISFCYFSLFGFFDKRCLSAPQIVLIVIVLGSLTLSVLLSGGSSGGVINLFRFIAYGIFFSFFWAICKSAAASITDVLLVIDIAFFVNVIVGSLQLFDPPILGEVVKVLFADNNMRGIFSTNPRIYGTFFNANWFGMYLSFMITGWIAVFLNKKRGLAWLIFRLIPAISLLFFSSSRTGMLSTIAGAGTILLLNFNSRSLQFKNAVKFLLFITIAVILFVLFLQLPETIAIKRKIYGLAKILSGNWQSIDSLRVRVECWQTAISFWRKSLLFGLGDNVNMPHNSYLTILVSFGVTGFAAVVSVFALIVANVYQTKTKSVQNKIMFDWQWGFSIALAIGMMAGDFIYTSMVMILWLFLSAAALAYKENQRDNEYILD